LLTPSHGSNAVERFALRDKTSAGKESFLFLTMLGYQTFAIEVILNSRQGASRAAKSSESMVQFHAEWNTFQHGNLVRVKVF